MAVVRLNILSAARSAMLSAAASALCAAVLIGAYAPKAVALELKPSEMKGKARQKSVYVLQNRFFKKSLRPEIGIYAGTFLNEAYTDTFGFGGKLSFHFTEWLAVEAFYTKTEVSDSEDKKALQQLIYDSVRGGTKVPEVEVNPVYSATDVTAAFSPFYGKLNFLDMLIVYSDLFLTGGVSSIDTFQGQKSGLVMGIGQRFYFHKSMSVSIDYRNRVFQELRGGQKTNKNSQVVNLGMGYFFR